MRDNGVSATLGVPFHNREQHMPESSARIAIFGAGAVGCYLGGCLAAAGLPVTLIARPRIRNDILACGLTATDWQGRHDHLEPEDLEIVLEPEALAGKDVILVTVKSGKTPDAADAIARYADPGTLVVSFQNGIGNAVLLRDKLPGCQVLQGMVPFNVIAMGPGRFHCATEGQLALEDGGEPAAGLIDGLRRAKLTPHLYRDIKPILWGKLLMNLNNAINALSGIPLVDELADRHYRRVLAASIREALQILHRAGIKPARTGKVVPVLIPVVLSLPTMLFRRVAGAMLKIDPSARSSMADDLLHRRLTEIDFINGEIVRLAAHINLKAPVNEQIVALIRRAESEGQGSPHLSGPDLIRQVLGAS